MRWVKETTARARGLRRRRTKAEEILWRALRNGRMKGVKFRRQHPVEGYFLDLASPSEFIAVECDGAGHLEKSAEDAERDARLRDLGWVVLRFGNHDVEERLHAVLETIALAVDDRQGRQSPTGAPPHPDPLP